MVSQNRTVDLICKLNPEVFKLINADVFGDVPQSLGSAQGAVTRITSPEYADMLKILMPTIISTNPDDLSWYKKVKSYWDSFGVKVPIGGIKLEIGFNFDISNKRCEGAIKQLKLSLGKDVLIDSDESLRDYVLKNINEIEKYKYANPVNVEQYLIWTFLLGHNRVAKHTDAIEKTTKIDFVLIDPKDIEDTRRANHSVGVEAMKMYLEILPDRTKIKDFLYIKGIDASSLDDIDADSKVKHIVDTNPKEFLRIIKDSAGNVKARVERYCLAGILKRLPNSSIIVDANDNGVLIGNTLDEAVVYFMSEAADRVAKVKEFKTRYAQLKKT